jgi:hypothetical protein
VRPPNIIKSCYETNERNKLLDAQKQSAPSLPNGKTRSDERQGEKPNKAFNFNIQKIMKGIMFNERYGLESAVLNGKKQERGEQINNQVTKLARLLQSSNVIVVSMAKTRTF